MVVPVRDDSRDAEDARWLAGGDAAGIERLYERYHGLAFGVAWRIVRDRGAAEDAVQEGFVRLWRARSRFNARRGTVRTWLLVIVSRCALSALARARRGGCVSGGMAAMAGYAASARTDTDVLQTMACTRIAAALGALPAAQRAVVELACFGGVAHGEIARQLGIPLGTVKGRLRLARRRLAATLAADG